MSIDTYAAGTCLIVASAVIAVLGLIAVRRTYNVRNLATIHEVSGQFLSIVGTLYAVLLGLIVVEAMSRFQQASTLVGDESNDLAKVIYLAGGMPALKKRRSTNGPRPMAASRHRSGVAPDGPRPAPAGSPAGRARSHADRAQLGTGDRA